mmetsp:Transcript_92083/g.159822  ORF Transcript_92083/g.159822 Transcript_92083/m.159822 type:complete len:226 (+) Transcript_92083:73-750(+)
MSSKSCRWHAAELLEPATQLDAVLFSVKAAAENAAAAAASAAAAVAGRPLRSTSFVDLTSSEIGPGEHLQPWHYHTSVKGGKAKIPQLRITNAPKGSESYAVVAQDVDDAEASHFPPPWGPAKVLWVRANIPITAIDNLGAEQKTGKKALYVGRDVLPYSGAWVNDDFIHRIYWRVFALKENIPDHIMDKGWPEVFKFLNRREFFRDDVRLADKGEFMTIAVRRE